MKHAIRSGVLVALVAAVINACGGDAHNSPEPGDTPGTPQSGAGSIAEGGVTAEPGSAGISGVEQGADGGASATDATGGAGTMGGNSGSSGTTNGGALSSAGAGASGGGISSGGAPSGGTPSTSGAGGESLIEPPPNCRSISQSEDAESCNYEYTCDALAHFDGCRRDSDGVWNCECGTFSGATRYFEVEGAEGLDACALIARVCETSDIPVSETRSCRERERTVDGDTCSAHGTCGNALDLDLGPDLVVRTVDNYWSRCKPTGNTLFADDGFDCTCDGGTFDREQHLVTAPSIDAVCQPMLQFCIADHPPASTDRVCRDAQPYGTVEQSCPMNPDCQGCAMAVQCGTAGHINSDVSLITLDAYPYRNIICRPQQGELHCTCEMYPEGVYSDESVPPATVELCRESSEVCAL